MEVDVGGPASHVELAGRLLHLILIEGICKEVQLVGEVGGEGLPLVPVPLLSASSLLIVLLITVLLTVTTGRLSTAEGSAECKKSKQEGPGENGVVEQEGRVQRDVVRD